MLDGISLEIIDPLSDDAVAALGSFDHSDCFLYLVEHLKVLTSGVDNSLLVSDMEEHFGEKIVGGSWEEASDICHQCLYRFVAPQRQDQL